jgi:hypothetical protein
MLLPHDVWLYFLANVGVVGLAGLLWVVSSVLLKAFVAYRQAVSPFSRTLAISALAATVGIVIQSAGGHMAFWPDYGLSSFYMVPYWILVGLAAARKRQWGVT